MLLDYLYLIIILVLIVVILFIIYLSYEYRTSGVDIEPFVIPIIDDMPPSTVNENITEKLNKYISNYDNLIVSGINNQLLIDQNNMEFIEDGTLKNRNDTKKILGLDVSPYPETNQFPTNKLIKTIKSNYNSQFISIHPQDTNNYGININDKCLTVRGLCDDEYCLQNCQNNLYITDSQKFKSNRINNAKDAAKFMSKYIGKSISTDKINSKNIYPFNVFTSAINNKCLSINNDGLFIEPCNLNSIHQQWQISPDENICIMK